MTESALYTGSLTHVRRAPAHAFRYRVALLYLDLDELGSLTLAPVLGVESNGLFSFRRADYLGPAEIPLKKAVLDRVEQALGERPDGSVRLLTRVRTLGRAFNPVSFYYCFRASGALAAVVAEITNTPWKERHAYVVPAGVEGVVASFSKAFHVSPFFPMEQRYLWRLPEPGASLAVEMANHEHGGEVFRARLALARRPLTRLGLLAALAAAPLTGISALFTIYLQALRLWLKRAPFHAHPHARLTTERRSEA